MLTPTKDRGAQAKAMPGLSVTADAEMTVTENAGFLGRGDHDGVNGDVVADLLSAMLAHERCGVHLYRSCAARTLNPLLQQRYRSFGEDTERHVTILEELITAAGGNPAYVSPSARVVQAMDSRMLESTFALSGSVDLATTEMAMLDAVFLAETTDNANWVLLERLTAMLPEGAVRDGCERAVAEVRGQEEEHLSWALQTKERMVMVQAHGDPVGAATLKVEEVVARIRNWFA